MTKDDIIRMAREAGLAVILEEHASEYGNGTFENTPYPELERFAIIAAERERETCAKLCDEEAREAYAAESVFLPQGNPLLIKIAEGARRCGNAIRARGTT